MIEDEGNHFKFWEYKKIGDMYIASWGRIGGDRPLGNKAYTEDEIKKLVKSKMRKGYKVVSTEG